MAFTPPTFRMANNPDSTPYRVIYTENIKNNIVTVETHPDLGTEYDAIEITNDLQRRIIEQEIIKKNIKK